MKKAAFQANYRYRNLSYFLLGLLFALAGCLIPPLIVMSFVLRSPGKEGPGVFGAIVLSALALMFVCLGLKLGKRILGRCFKDERLEVVIGRTGIDIGDAHYPWREVGWIRGAKVLVISA